jgi:hypothetical protein
MTCLIAKSLRAWKSEIDAPILGRDLTFPARSVRQQIQDAEFAARAFVLDLEIRKVLPHRRLQFDFALVDQPHHRGGAKRFEMDAIGKTVSGVTGCGSSTLVTPKLRTVVLPFFINPNETPGTWYSAIFMSMNFASSSKRSSVCAKAIAFGLIADSAATPRNSRLSTGAPFCLRSFQWRRNFRRCKEFPHCTGNDIHMRLKREVSGIEKFDDRVGIVAPESLGAGWNEMKDHSFPRLQATEASTS